MHSVPTYIITHHAHLQETSCRSFFFTNIPRDSYQYDRSSYK